MVWKSEDCQIWILMVPIFMLYVTFRLPPAVFEFSMPLQGNQIDTVIFERGISIDGNSADFDHLFFDSEGLIYHPDKDIYTVSSEGSVKYGSDTFIAEVDSKGEVLALYERPTHFTLGTKKGRRTTVFLRGSAMLLPGMESGWRLNCR